MKYVVRMVGTCPEGAVENVEYWIAQDEAEMKAMIEVQRELSYTGITCLGPVVDPNKFMREKIANKLLTDSAPEQ
jgi:hypothetical protein